MKFHHFGFRVENLDEAVAVAETGDGRRLSGKIVDPLWGVTVCFLSIHGFVVEFVEGRSRNHICFASNDMENDIKRIGGILVRQPAPAVAFGGRKIAWVYTRGCWLIEFVSLT